MYKIFESDSFYRELKKMANPSEEQRVLKKLKQLTYPQLRQEPHFGKNIRKLADYSPESWRYRIGDFRVFYSIDEPEKTVIITAIRRRRENTYH